tara:strand:+ start:99 stop:458 length:360 start_codon:yes stop_codon:yes gene_type:complete
MNAYIVNKSTAYKADDKFEFNNWTREVFSSIKKAKAMMHDCVWNSDARNCKIEYPASISERKTSLDEVWTFEMQNHFGDKFLRRLHLQVLKINDLHYETRLNERQIEQVESQNPKLKGL